MSHNVLVTGAGKAVGLGFNLVLRYLEAGSTVCATIRKPCKELDELKHSTQTGSSFSRWTSAVQSLYRLRLSI